MEDNPKRNASVHNFSVTHVIDLPAGAPLVIEQNKSLVRRWVKDVRNDGREETISHLSVECGQLKRGEDPDE
jgi:hypothetical protein